MLIELPVMPAEHAIRLHYDNIYQNAITRTLHSPSVSFVSPVPGSSLVGDVPVIWSMSDQDGDALHASLQYSHNGTDWMPLVDLEPTSSTVVDTALLPAAAAGSFRVTVSDGFNTTSAIVSQLIKSTNIPPDVFILSPSPGEVFRQGSNIPLSVSVDDAEDGTSLPWSNVVWQSSVDGLIGTGALRNTSTLSPGSHALIVTVADSGGQIAQRSVNISVVP